MARSDVATEYASHSLVPWINRALEVLWLLTVVMVPVIFFRPDDFLSETVIAYVEGPKIALLRTLVALMTIFWLVEWGLKGRLPLSFLAGIRAPKFEPRAWYGSLAHWLKDRPARWVMLSVWLFLAVTLLTTALSASLSVSLWGEIPGQDGFAAYNVVAYILLFGVVSTHLKTPAQVWRLLAAVVAAGTLVAGYAIFQHYGHDFLGILEITGGSGIRATSTLGNAVFAGSVLLMPIVISLVLATVSISRLAATGAGTGPVRPGLILLAVLALWALVLAVQLLGITFTLSRGSWIGTMLSLIGFLSLAAIFVGWRPASWAALVLAMAGGVTWLVLQSPDLTSIAGGAPWAVVVLLLAGLLGMGAVLWRTRPTVEGGEIPLSPSPLKALLPGHPHRRLVGLGMVFGVAALAMSAAFLWFTNDGGARGNGSPAAAESNAAAVQKRFTSITAEVTGDLSTGSMAQRSLIWQASWRLVRDVPWFDFDSLSLPWLRPIIGYGPDMFRYAFLLESTSAGGSDLPLEPDHAHNFFIHQTVEQGFLGLLSALGVFGAMFGAGGYLLLRKRQRYPDVFKLLLVGLLAVMAGRLTEQMVGVARVSDLTVFWVLLAVFAALPGIMQVPEPAAPPTPQQSSRSTRPRMRRGARDRAPAPEYDWHRLARLALVAWAVGWIVVLTWFKTISYPRAGIAAADAVASFERGEIQGAVSGLDRSIQLAPDVPVYYNFKASVLAAYWRHPDLPAYPECRLAGEGSAYEICLGEKIYLTNLAGVHQRPFYWRTRLALADAALALGRQDEAIRLYREVLASVPASWPLHNRLAEAYIDVGRPGKALEVLEQSLNITGQSQSSTQAHRLQNIAYQRLEEEKESSPSATAD